MEFMVPFLTLKVHTHTYLTSKSNKLLDAFTLKSGARCVSISITFPLKVLGTIRQGGKTIHVRIEKGTWEKSSQSKKFTQ